MTAIPEEWQQADSPIDFIIVGGGAAGCPLAARLAERGYVVLVIEMGPESPPLAPDSIADSTIVPLLHPEATEDPRHSLHYFVQQRDGVPQQPRESLGDVDHGDTPGPESAPVFYPRGQGIGGCSIHNAMITMCGPNEDWDEMAEITGDPSWGARAMRTYFERLEDCAYAQPQTWWERLAARLFGRTGWENCRHGTDGWLTTTLPDVHFLQSDKAMLRVVLSAAATTLRTGLDQIGNWLHFTAKGRARSAMDPNHWDNIERQRIGVIQIPCAIDRRGRRSSPRERLFNARAKCPERLLTLTGVLVTAIELHGKRAVGVRVLPRAHAYQADPNAQAIEDDLRQQTRVIRCRYDVVLSAGAFNTPQLLMLSGIGDPEHLKDIPGVTVVHPLPGVGRNLQDRYEVAVQTTMSQPFASLAGVTLCSNVNTSDGDALLKQYLKAMEQTDGSSANRASSASPGVYASNGALVGILVRSSQEDKIADLFIMALAGRFAGYRPGWSSPSSLIPGFDSLERGKLAEHRTVSWLILKARSRNRAGRVRLKSDNPIERPEINFRSFSGLVGEGAEKSGDQDLLALEEGVIFLEKMLKKGRAQGDVQHIEFPGRGENQELRDWIRQTAWGHHACGTCKMGVDDEMAVVDPRFQVHGIEGLRIVDASIFPRIPGYFIATNIYMAAEKAADVLTEDHPRTPEQLETARASGSGPPVIPSQPAERERQIFPREFEAAEAALVRQRRRAARS